MVYGPHGVGKTSLAARLRSPTLIDLEAGSDEYDVPRMEAPDEWATLLEEVGWAAASLNPGDTLVIDTADAAETMCAAHVCKKAGKDSIEQFGYGKGYTFLRDEFGKLLKALDMCVDHDVNVCVTAHEQVGRVDNPDGTTYSVWGTKLSKYVAPLLADWADAVLRMHFIVLVEEPKGGGRGRATGGDRRAVQCVHSATVDAKNRWGLPFELDVDAAVDAINSHFIDGPSPDATAPLREELFHRMGGADITKRDVEEAVIEQWGKPDGTTVEQYGRKELQQLLANWDKLSSYIEQRRAERADVPFD